MKKTLLLLLVFSAIFISCGDSKIEVQSTLLVVDTYPSNGAEVDPSLDRIIVFFSSSLDESQIKNESFVLELVGGVDVDVAGVQVKTEILNLSEDRSAVTLSIGSTPLTGGSIYRLSVSDVKSATGSLLAHKYYTFFSVKTK
ncbi:MAG: Ig-like domain-containing protein [Myxococcota bacterium]